MENICQYKHLFLFLFLLISPLMAYAADSSLAPDSGTAGILYAPRQNDIIIVDKGWIPSGNNSTGMMQSFTTHSLCPNNYNPYIQMNFGKVGHAGASQKEWGHMRTFGICLSSVTKRSSYYDVNYYAVKNFTDVYSKMDQDFVYNDEGNRNIYGSDDEWQYAWHTSRLLGSRIVDQPGAHRYNELGAINWTLYCYPQWITPPYDQVTAGDAQCDINSSPFSNAGP